MTRTGRLVITGLLTIGVAMATGGVAHATENAGPPPFECSYDFRNTSMEWRGERWFCINENRGNTFPSGYQWVQEYRQV